MACHYCYYFYLLTKTIFQLANPEVLTALSNNNLDLSMRLALTEKVDEMLSKVPDFNPQLYASLVISRFIFLDFGSW